MTFGKSLNLLLKTISKSKPEILTGFGIAGGALTVFLSCRATIKAVREVDKAEKEKGAKLSKKEIVKVSWKFYISPALTGAASVVCAIGSGREHASEAAALASAVNISQSTLADYKEAAIETVGEKKEQEIQDRAKLNRAETIFVNDCSGVIFTGKGNTLFLDYMSHRWYRSDKNFMDSQVNILNNRMNSNEPYISCNEYYDAICLDSNGFGELLGWTRQNGLITPHYTWGEKNGEPYAIVDFLVEPQYDYADLH